MTELDDLRDLPAANVTDLVHRAVLDGVRLDAIDLSGVSVADLWMLDFALVDCTASTLELPGVTAVGVYVGRLNAQTLSCAGGEWRDVIWADLRVGALLADGSEFTDVTIRDSRIDLLSLRGARIRRLTLSNCRIDALDISMATVQELIVKGGSVGELLSDAATMAHADFSGTELGALGHPGSLRGVVLCPAQIDDIAPSLARHLGIAIHEHSPVTDE